MPTSTETDAAAEESMEEAELSIMTLEDDVSIASTELTLEDEEAASFSETDPLQAAKNKQTEAAARTFVRFIGKRVKK